jgi:glycosyltransferase involved in cell wall biosynthesis
MILLWALILTVLVNCAYFLLFARFSYLNNSESANPSTYKNTADSPGISLLVCAKNEAENLKVQLPLLLKQDYPNFEIILINDASRDNTQEVMEAFASENPKISIVNVVNNEAFWGSKKYALTLGIKRAKNQRMLFTDADCHPGSKQWLSIMVSHFSNKKQLVLGYGAYLKRPGLLNRFIRFETLLTALQYFSYAKAGIPYMGVGRNIGYTTNLYYGNNGFTSHMKIPSGDDDLFVNEVGTSKNTAICFADEAFTFSLPKRSWNAWWLQKKRHITTAKYYKPKHKFLLGTYYLFNLLFWILLIASVLLLNWQTVLIIIGLRFTFQYVVVGKAASKLNEKDLIPYIPVLELFLVFAQMSIFISNSISKSTRWK